MRGLAMDFDMDDHELLAAAQYYGVKVTPPRRAQVNTPAAMNPLAASSVSDEVDFSDDELLGLAQQYGIKASKPIVRQSQELPSTVVRPNYSLVPPEREIGTSGVGDWMKRNTGFDLDTALAPARKARREQQALGPVDEIGMKLAAGANAALDFAEAVPNILLGTDAGRFIPETTALTDPRLFSIKHLQLIPYAAQTSRNITQAGKRFLANSNVVKLAPEAYRQYTDLAANLAPFPNVSVAETLAKAGLPAMQNAIKAGKRLPSIIDNASVGASLSAATNASQQYDQSSKIDPLTTLLFGAGGGAFGAGIGIAGSIPKWAGQLMARVRNKPAQQQAQVVQKIVEHVQAKNSSDPPSVDPQTIFRTLSQEGIIDHQDEEIRALMQMRANILNPETKAAASSQKQLPLDEQNLEAANEHTGSFIGEYSATKKQARPDQRMKFFLGGQNGDQIDIILPPQDKLLWQVQSNFRKGKGLADGGDTSINGQMIKRGYDPSDMADRMEFSARLADWQNRVKLQARNAFADGFDSVEIEPFPQRMRNELSATQDPLPPSPEPTSNSPRREVTGRVVNGEEGEFRYNTPEKVGYERSSYYRNLNELSDRADRRVVEHLSQVGANQKYLEQVFEAKLADYARKHGDPNWVFDSFGLKGGVDFEVNLGRDFINELDQVRFDLADDTYDKYPAGIRGLSEAGYGQGRNWLPAELPMVSDEPADAMAELAASRMEYLAAQKEFKRLKELHKEKVFQMQNRLRADIPVPDGGAPSQLQIIADITHPAGAEYGRVKYGIETYHNTMGLHLPEEARAIVSAKRKELEDELTQGLTKGDWLDILKVVDKEMSTANGLAPMHELEKGALALARKKGFDLTRIPFKLNLKFSDWRRGDKSVIRAAEEILQSKQGRSVIASSLLLAFQMQQEAEAAEEAQKKKTSKPKSDFVGLWALATALGITVSGAKAASVAIRTKALVRVANCWRDTFDIVKMLDNLAGSDFFTVAMEHLALCNKASFGVEFDNPEQLMRAIQEFKTKQPGAAFNSLSPRQQVAIIDQHAVRRSLAKKLDVHIENIENRLDPSYSGTDALPLDQRTQSAVEALYSIKEALTPHVTEGSNPAAWILANLMDTFFFWNPKHHSLNLLDQWIMGGSYVGVHNIFRANTLLNGVGGHGGDAELRLLFNNSNLIGGIRVERAEQRALASGKKQSKLDKVLNSDLPSDKVNGDRVALASILEYAQLNKSTLKALGFKSDVDFAKAFLRDQLDPATTLSTWVHMTERLSRSLGVDPLRLNKGALSRSPYFSKIMVFFKQPERMARMLNTMILTGNFSGLMTLIGMQALFGGRAAIPADISAVWQNVDPNSYFQAAHQLDQMSLYQRLTGQSISSKLTYGWNYYAMGSTNLIGESMKSASADGILHSLATWMKRKGDVNHFSRKELQELRDSQIKFLEGIQPLLMPRVLGMPEGVLHRAAKNADAAINDEKKLSFYEGDKRYAPTRTIHPSEFGLGAMDFAKDVVLPGTPAKLDQIQQSEFERFKRKKALNKQSVRQSKQAYKTLIPLKKKF